MKSAYSKLLNIYTLFLAFCTFLLIIAGGLVTSTDSGLSVPDWPLSYGKVMPPMVGGIFYEHGHRMIATLVGVLTVVLAIVMFRKESRTWLRKLSIVALLAVVLQGILGGLTVLFLLPTWISVSHAALAQTFFCIVASIALFQSSWWQSNNLELVEEVKGKPVFKFGIVVVGTVFLQLLFGALMRHTDSGLVVPDFPLAYGQLFPSLSSDALGQYTSELIARDIRLAADGPVTANQIIIHMLHRFWALVTAILVLAYAYRVFRMSQHSKRLRIPAVGLLVLIPVQITLGAFTVLSRKAVDVTTIHVATGALILMTSVVVTLMLYRITPHTVKQPSMTFDLKEAVV